MITVAMDSGQYFQKGRPNAWFSRVKNSQFHPILRASKVLEGLGSQKNLISQNAEIKVCLDHKFKSSGMN